MSVGFEERAQALRARISDPDFLANRGLGNEVGIYFFCYDPAEELEARALFSRLARESETGHLPCKLVEFNLYDLVLELCDKARISDAIDRMEQKRGTEALLAQLSRTASAEAVASVMAETPLEPGSVVLITGVGEVYPLLRAHVLLDNLQHLITTVPVVVAYPGAFDGQSLRLFAGKGRPGLTDGNYYRAFSLV